MRNTLFVVSDVKYYTEPLLQNAPNRFYTTAGFKKRTLFFSHDSFHILSCGCKYYGYDKQATGLNQ